MDPGDDPRRMPSECFFEGYDAVPETANRPDSGGVSARCGAAPRELSEEPRLPALRREVREADPQRRVCRAPLHAASQALRHEMPEDLEALGPSRRLLGHVFLRGGGELELDPSTVGGRVSLHAVLRISQETPRKEQ